MTEVQDIPDRLRKYMNGLSDMMHYKAMIASSAGHKPDIGTIREIVVETFLQKHLPRRLTPHKGGRIYSSYKEEEPSGQIDVIITGDEGINFNENEVPFCFVENVFGAISIKSNINKKELNNALDNLHSIPKTNIECVNFGILELDLIGNYKKTKMIRDLSWKLNEISCLKI